MSRGTDPAEVEAGRLAPCPASPNCVSSQAEDDAHRVEPLRYQGDVGNAMERLRRAVVSMPRSAIVRSTDRYLHVEFTSAVFRFVDDLELLIDPEQHVVHVRSASRVGYSDLGANRKRVEELRRAFRG